MVTYGIIAGSVLLGTIITFSIGMLCSYKIVKYSINLGLKMNRFTETGELIKEDYEEFNQETTE